MRVSSSCLADHSGQGSGQGASRVYSFLMCPTVTMAASATPTRSTLLPADICDQFLPVSVRASMGQSRVLCTVRGVNVHLTGVVPGCNVCLWPLFTGSKFCVHVRKSGTLYVVVLSTRYIKPGTSGRALQPQEQTFRPQRLDVNESLHVRNLMTAVMRENCVRDPADCRKVENEPVRQRTKTRSRPLILGFVRWGRP